MLRYFLLTIIPLLIFSTANAQDKSKKWDVNNPPTPYQTFNFTTDEGTWMNVDVSPDGKQIVFDLLGDIYIMPFSGGKATVLRSGLAFEVQPRFSPDGKKILFTSDAGGGDNIWVMNANGTDAKQITKEDFRLLNNATWSPDGNYIIARKHFTSTRSLGAGEMWIYHISGGEGLQLTARKNDQQDVNEPVSSPDGRYVYFSEDMYPGGFFQYNKDPNNQIFVVKRFDRNENKIENVTGGPGSACRPQISHNGKLLAFVKRVRTKSVLYIRDLDSGEEYPVFDQLSKDQMEAWTTFGSYTGFSFTPNDQQIVIWANGKINLVDINGFNKFSIIPFSANVSQKMAPTVRFQQNINQPNDTVHVIRNATTSPDGNTIVFNAIGKLWKKNLPNGKPELILKTDDIVAEPEFSPDGKSIVFVTWNDLNGGAIYTSNLNGSNLKKLTSKKAVFRNPSFSPDGKKIIFEESRGDNVLGTFNNLSTGIYMMDVDGKNLKFISKNGSNPKLNKSGDKIFVNDGNDFLTYDLNGKDERKFFTGKYGSQFIISPDEKWVAFVYLHNVYVAEFPSIGKTIDLSSTTKSIPVKVVSKDAGINLHWSGDSKKIHYTLGNQYYTISLKDRFEYLENIPDSLFKMPEQGLDIGLVVPQDIPKGLTAFTNAKIITMNGDQIIENGIVLVENNIIKSIGKMGEISVPKDAFVLDCSGKTIMPGMIDAHAHGVHFRSGLTPQQHWPYYTNLAFGVTTMHDPSANSEMVFTQSEMIKSGNMVGPRVFSTGTILYGADGDFKAVINSLDDAKSALRRTKAYGAWSVKSYNQPRREQNQMVLEAARELKMEVVPEGGSFFYHNLAMIADGHTTIEHNLPIATLHNDVIQFWKNAKTGYTPTLIVCYGAPNGEYYWYQHTNVWEDKKLLSYTPRSVIDTRARWRTILPEEEYENGHILVSKQAKKLNDVGVKVNIGAHGQIQGIGAHWEIWMMQQGGMTNLEALKTATINPAISLGLDKSIGSIEVGKLADIIVMDKDPLTNIQNTNSVSYTMVNGKLYDTKTMNQIGNTKKERLKFYWEAGRNANLVDWPGGDGHNHGIGDFICD